MSICDFWPDNMWPINTWPLEEWPYCIFINYPVDGCILSYRTDLSSNIYIPIILKNTLEIYNSLLNAVNIYSNFLQANLFNIDYKFLYNIDTNFYDTASVTVNLIYQFLHDIDLLSNNVVDLTIETDLISYLGHSISLISGLSDALNFVSVYSINIDICTDFGCESCQLLNLA